MEDFEIKYVTEIAQIRNIINDDCTLAQYIVKEYLDLIGAMSVDEYSKHLEISKRTIQDRIKKNKIEFIEIGNQKFPCINIQ